MIRLHYMCAALQRSGPIRPINNNSMKAPAGSEERHTVPEWCGWDTDCERGGKRMRRIGPKGAAVALVDSVTCPHGFVDG